MRFGLYDKPINDEVSKYKGLYRENELIDFCEKSNSILTNMIEWFFSQSRDGMHIKYTEENMNKMVQFLDMLRDEKWKGELLLFTDDRELEIPFGFELIGYDICADSMYYSPLGDGFLTSYIQSETFFNEMSLENYRDYAKNLNNFGLFKSYVVAEEFAKYCNKINSLYPHTIESEENWRPFMIYSWMNG